MNNEAIARGAVGYWLRTKSLGAVPPSSVVPLRRRWLKAGVTWLTLENLESGRTGNVFLSGFFQIDGACYLLIEPDPAFADERDSQRQTLVRFDARTDTLTTLSEEEFQTVMSQEASCLPESGLPCQGNLLFGDLPGWDELKFSLDDLQEMGITSRLGLFATEGIAGASFKVELKWQESGHAYVLLQSQGEPLPAEYSLNWLFEEAGDSYVILCYPPPVRADELVSTKIVMKVRDERTFVGINKDDLLRLACSCVAVVEGSRRSNCERMSLVLGAFPSWQEVKDEVDRRLSGSK